MQRDRASAAGSDGAAAAPGALAIICGGGTFPAAVADAVAKSGRRLVMFGLRNWADAALIERYPHHWIAIGQLGRFLRLAHEEQCSEVLLIGTLMRPSLSAVRLDWRTLCLLPRIVRAFRGGDDHLLSAVARMIEAGGLRVIGVEQVAAEIMAPLGVLGSVQPTERDRSDIARALALIAAMGPFDVGQAAIVADNHVLAVEAAEGTDNMLLRIGEMRRQRRVVNAAGVGVLVKAPKPGQDRRFDLPSIGTRTVENAIAAGLAGIAVAAGSTIVADPGETIACADRARMFVVGVAAGAPQ